MAPAAGVAAGALEVRGGLLLPMDPAAPRALLPGSLWIRDGAIVAVGGAAPEGWTAGGPTEVLDAAGCLVLPGLVQAHTHVCQTLCRGAADDLPLLEWLRQRVWPHEAALDERALSACARLAGAELLRGGTTAILDMGTVHGTDVLAAELAGLGLRAVIGNSLIDQGRDHGVPARLVQTTAAALDEADRLRAGWSGAADGRIGFAYAPRFVLSCSEGLLAEVAARVAAGARLHTHASEQLAEVALVRAARGDDNVRYLHRLGLGGPRATFAHCVHLTADEIALLAQSGTHVAHCPSSNLKLASGIAPLPELLAAGVSVALGADGAPCNNNLDAFQELRLCALVHRPRAGAAAVPAWTALELATVGGARALGLADQVGSLLPGRRADLIVVDPRAPHVAPTADPAAALCFAARSSDVRHVVIDGRVLLRERELTALTGLDVAREVGNAVAEAARIEARAAAHRA